MDCPNCGGITKKLVKNLKVLSDDEKDELRSLDGNTCSCSFERKKELRMKLESDCCECKEPQIYYVNDKMFCYETGAICSKCGKVSRLQYK